jgi:hypothetical protein
MIGVCDSLSSHVGHVIGPLSMGKGSDDDQRRDALLLRLLKMPQSSFGMCEALM